MQYLYSHFSKYLEVLYLEGEENYEPHKYNFLSGKDHKDSHRRNRTQGPMGHHC